MVSTKKILVVVHLYYQDLWDTLKEYLNNIDSPYDLVVSLTDKNSSIEQKIYDYKKDASIVLVENKGYDI